MHGLAGASDSNGGGHAMRFVGILVTERKLDRPVQKFGPDQVNTEGICIEYLKAAGKPGDRFEISDLSPKPVSSLTLTGPGTVERKGI